MKNKSHYWRERLAIAILHSIDGRQGTRYSRVAYKSAKIVSIYPKRVGRTIL